MSSTRLQGNLNGKSCFGPTAHSHHILPGLVDPDFRFCHAHTSCAASSHPLCTFRIQKVPETHKHIFSYCAAEISFLTTLSSSEFNRLRKRTPKSMVYQLISLHPKLWGKEIETQKRGRRVGCGNGNGREQDLRFGNLISYMAFDLGGSAWACPFFFTCIIRCYLFSS